MTDSSLYNEKTFYRQFIKDILSCKKEVIIESPFISSRRMRQLYSIFEELIAKEVKVYIITRDPKEHMHSWAQQAEDEIQRFERLGVQVLLWRNHHRKLAILDRKLLWEGSLNILSHTTSWEVMRRINSPRTTIEMFEFLNLERFI